MPNGFDGSAEEWQRIEAPLLDIDDLLTGFVRQHNVKLEKNSHNWPNRRIRWRSRGVERCIQITVSIERGSVKSQVALLAWQDREGKRYLKDEWLKQSPPWDEMRHSIQEVLDEGYRALDSWSETDLQYATDLSI
jgi:hypothetical protein